MSEAMAVESIVEAEWLMQNYWTKMRFAYQTPRGSWSDVDILAYHPEKKHLVIGESKVQGEKNEVRAFVGEDITKHWYFDFLANLPRVCEDGVVFGDFAKMVKKLTIQHVSNLVVPEARQEEVVNAVRETILSSLPDSTGIEVEVRIESTLDVLARVIKLEGESAQGRRYGHPVMDIAREINRYLHSVIAGRSKVDVSSEMMEEFESALGMRKVDKR